jgi:hypothetical protein
LIAGNTRLFRSWGWLLLSVAIFGWPHFEARAQKQPASAEPPSVAWRAPAEGKPEDYAGAEVCAACHADQARQFRRPYMPRPRWPGRQLGRESCHGPGLKNSSDRRSETPANWKRPETCYGFHGKPAECRPLPDLPRNQQNQSLFGRSNTSCKVFRASATPRICWAGPKIENAGTAAARRGSLPGRR